MTSRSQRLPNLLPSGLQIQQPSLATRRFVRHQRRLLKRPEHPLERDRVVLDEPRTSGCSLIPCRKRQDFSFLAPTGHLVTFVRPVLLPRALEFELPPEYGSPSLQSLQNSPRPSSHVASVGEQVAPLPICDMPSPAPSEESIPSYSEISPGAPSDHGYDNFVQPGLENEVYDYAVGFAETANLYYKTAPWTSDPEAHPCQSKNCPLWPMPHNLGLYFHYGKRPSEELQSQLQNYGIPSIFEGGNPPQAIWESLMDEYYGNSTDKSWSMLLRYRRYHCYATIRSGDVEDVLLAYGARARLMRRHHRANETWREDQQQVSSTSTSLDNNWNGRSQSETGIVDNTDDMDNENTTANTSTGGVDRGRETNPDLFARQVTELTYWSVLGDQHTAFQKYGLLPPPRQPVEPQSFVGISPGHRPRTPHEGSNSMPCPYVSPMMMTFMEEIGLAGIWGPNVPGFTISHALIRLVQRASPMEAADIRLVDKFRLEYVYGYRPLVASVPRCVVSEELWLSVRRCL